MRSNERDGQIDLPLRDHAEKLARAADKLADQQYRDKRERDMADQQRLRDLLDRGRPGRHQETRTL
jgi:hypothetical protein